MKRHFVFLILFQSTMSFAQNIWTPTNGPWTGGVSRDIAVGYSTGSSTAVVYMSQVDGPLLKSIDGGITWSHIEAIQNAGPLVCLPDNRTLSIR